MVAFSFQLALVVGLIGAALAMRAVARNRHVQRRQRLTILLALGWILVELGLGYDIFPPAVAEHARPLAQVGLALAVINFLVVTLVNPLGEDRAPERFPVILQDTVIMVVFAVVATAILRERVLALSAVSAVVIGFALQETLGNAFAGLAIQTEKPFQVGQWIRVGEHDGLVTEVTWRATKLRTRDDSFLVVPNNLMAREMVLNYSEPVLPTRLSVEVGADYGKPPNEVKAAILEAIGNAPLALRSPHPDALLESFGDSAIVYRARFWIEDMARVEAARDQVRTAIWYSFKRRGIDIPWPIQVQYEREESPARAPESLARSARALGRVDVFAALDDAERRDLAELSAERVYAAGDVVVHQGAAGASMFIVCEGEVEVLLEPGGQRVAAIGPAGFFGEMSLLTGEPRTATVRAVTDALLLEILSQDFRRFVLERPAVLEPVTAAAARRRDELTQTRERAAQPATRPNDGATFLTVVRRFLGLE